MNIKASLLMFLPLFLPLALQAASLETLVMPGAVIEAHAELEETCSNCHDAFDRARQRQLCLECHEEVAADISEHRGFHGLNPQAADTECNSCHGEHLGRDADITGLERDLFNHAVTDFPLTDAHAGQTCNACHADDAPYRDAPASCIGCHQDDDVHGGTLGEECDSCHRPQQWRQTLFDHSDTQFPLLGVHAETSCGGCHSDQTYADTPMTCISCHQQDDVHDGSRGEACADCHTSQDWSAEFDHLQETGFALQGAHADLVCANCHVTDAGQAFAALPNECHGCHASDDVHLGRNGADCAECHGQSSWRLSFDHLAASGFALEGSHGGLKCESCHTGRLTDPLPQDCWGCHERTDPHGGMLLECEDCHGQQSFAEGLTFHHDLARFALVGLHRSASCEQCHDGLVFSPLDGVCFDCHAAEDAHAGSLGEQCGDCHNPVGWEYWTFDHAATGFELTGSHAGLTCDSCHGSDQNRSDTPSTCIGCHRSDDKHHGAFGGRCDRCHSTETFSQPELGRR